MKKVTLSHKHLFLSFFFIFVTLNAFQLMEGKVHFVVIGDRTGSSVPGIFNQIIEEVERLKPDFVVTIGDMIEGYTKDTSLINSEWEEFKSLLTPLTMPIYFTPGNHDIWDDVSLKFYEHHIGKPYYSFDFKGLHFIILDNSRWESSKELPEKEIKWLIEDLKEHRNSPYTFVFFHKPFWFKTIADKKPDTLHTLFKNFGVDAVFSGHFHIYFSGKYDGILYTGVGSSGGASEQGPTGLHYHFLWVTVDRSGVSISPIKMGSVLPWEELTAQELKFINRIELSGLNFENSIPLDKNFNLEEEVISLKLKNPHLYFVLQDTLKWELPEGWYVEPRISPLKLNPGDSAILKFKVKKERTLYPVPTVSLEFPYSEGKNYSIKKPLPVSRKTICYRMETPPLIDGEISETAWKNPVTRLFSPNGGPMKIDSVYFYFSYDEKNLYISAHCKELKMDSIFANTMENDGPVYAEDCVGYFFEPIIKGGTAYQIYFNPMGTVFDQKITISPEGEINADKSWNGIYEVKTKWGEDFWNIEIRIPLNQFGVKVVSGQEWRVNFRRKQKRLNSAADWQVPITYDPGTYGFLIFE